MKLLCLFLLCIPALAQHPQAESSTSNAELQSSISAPQAQGLVVDGQSISLSRWAVSLYAIHDPIKGWGGSSRVDYRINNRWGLAVTQVNTVTSGGFTLRLGKVKK